MQTSCTPAQDAEPSMDSAEGQGDDRRPNKECKSSGGGQWNDDGIKAAMQEYIRHTIDQDVPISSLEPASYSAAMKAVKAILMAYEGDCAMGEFFDDLLGIERSA